MRVALAGKGGVGKTTLSATLSRLVARNGPGVVAIDADSNPNLAAALGITDGEEPDFLPFGLVSRKPDGPALTAPIDEVLARHAVRGPDGVTLLRMGQPQHADEGCLCSAHATVSAVLADLGAQEGVVTVMDLEASPEHLSRGTARHADTLVMVTEPYYRSLETIRRLGALAVELAIPRIGVVANKVRSDEERDAVTEFCHRHELDFIGAVPWDSGVMDADAAGRPLLDTAADSPVVDAVRRLIDHLQIPTATEVAG